MVIPVYSHSGQPLKPFQGDFQNLADLQANVARLQIQDIEEVLVYDSELNIITAEQGSLSPKSIRFIIALDHNNPSSGFSLDKFVVYTRRVDSCALEVEVCGHDSIGWLKQHISQKWEIPADKQHLFYAGEVLTQDHQTLMAQGVENDKIIHVIDKRNVANDPEEMFEIRLSGPKRDSASFPLSVTGSITLKQIAAEASKLFKLPEECVVLGYCAAIQQDLSIGVGQIPVERNSSITVFDDREAIEEEVTDSEGQEQQQQEEQTSQRKQEEDPKEQLQKKEESPLAAQDKNVGSVVSGAGPLTSQIQKPEAVEESVLEMRRAQSIDFREANSLLNSTKMEFSYEESIARPGNSQLDVGFVAVHIDPYGKDNLKTVVEQVESVSRDFDKKASAAQIPVDSAPAPEPVPSSQTEEKDVDEQFQFQLKVRDFSENEVVIKVNKAESVADIKQRVQLEYPFVEEGNIQLLYQGRVLNDQDLVKDIGLTSESQLFMMTEN